MHAAVGEEEDCVRMGQYFLLRHETPDKDIAIHTGQGYRGGAWQPKLDDEPPVLSKVRERLEDGINLLLGRILRVKDEAEREKDDPIWGLIHEGLELYLVLCEWCHAFHGGRPLNLNTSNVDECFWLQSGIVQHIVRIDKGAIQFGQELEGQGATCQ